MSKTIVILVIVLAVIMLAVIGVVSYLQAQKRRSQQLRDRFGPEYDRSLERAGGRRGAESELRSREKRQLKLTLRTLEASQRREFEQRWTGVQREFVDDPGRAVHDADRLVIDVMSARGYPVGDFDQRAGDLSVQYPVATGHYRQAHRISQTRERGEAGTEELRQALTSYRSLIDALLRDTDNQNQPTEKETRA